MNMVKFFKVDGNNITVCRVKVTQRRDEIDVPPRDRRIPTLAQAIWFMRIRGFSRERPKNLKGAIRQPFSTV